MKVGKIRPSIRPIRHGSDGDVYAEEVAYAEKRGLQWKNIDTIYGANEEPIGCRLDFGDAGAVTIYGLTDE